ncbi:MAG: putative toxin-antitoxin system toxin component, PIN family [candidate division NC10 bacterium]|nr:putative toxin-antitoxin system toxin component, PIN family [candidate division NC10 bacterium]
MPERVIFDTNVLISGYLWRGLPRRALEHARRGRYTLLLSQQTIEEFIRILGSPKFGLTAEEIVPILADLTSLAEFVEVRETVSVIREDPTDNIFLGPAVQGDAAYIVSGDRHLLRLKEFRGSRIVTTRQFLRLLGLE